MGLNSSHTLSLKHIVISSVSKQNKTLVVVEGYLKSQESNSPQVILPRLEKMVNNFNSLNLSPNLTCEEEKSAAFADLFSSVKK